MRSYRQPIILAPGKMDRAMAFLAMALAAEGLIMVFSASTYYSFRHYGSEFDVAIKQGKFVLLGLAVMFGVGSLDYHRFTSKKILLSIFFGTVFFLLLVHCPKFAAPSNGASRWVTIFGQKFQPAEFAKVAAVVILAAGLARKGEDRLRSFRSGFTPSLGIPLLFTILILFQKDIGSGVVILGVATIMLFAAGARWRHLGLSVLVCGAGAFLVIITSPRRQKLILNYFADRNTGLQDVLWHLDNSKIAFGSGGFFGLQPGRGMQKLGFLPEIHKESILASIGEEAGFLGVLLTLILFSILLSHGLSIARKATDPLGRHIATGAVCVLGLEIIINIWVVLDLAPNKGMALPFLSYGGSSLVASFMLVGLLLSVSRWSEKDWTR